MYITDPLQFIALHLFVFGVSVVTALLEIQIEGANGWAAKLPTWHYAPAWVKRYLGISEITGYHLCLMGMLVLLFHFPLVLTGWSLYAELTILSAYFAFTVFWDFLWFVLNPAFGWCRYQRDSIWWFPNWLGSFPVNYYIGLGLSALMAFLRGMTADATGNALLGGMAIPLQHAVGWLAGAAITVLATSLLVRKRGCPMPAIPNAAPQSIVMPVHGN